MKVSFFIRQPPMYKDERQIVTRVLAPFLKRKNYLVKNFVRLERLKETLRKKEVILDREEEEFNHPWRPGDIDILFWKMKFGIPTIHAAEVKYFRLRKLPVRSKMDYVPKSQRGEQANVKPFPEAHEGLGQAAMLLSFGVDYVHLIHVFDPISN